MPTKANGETLISHPSKSQQTPRSHHPPGLLVDVLQSPPSLNCFFLPLPDDQVGTAASAQQESPQCRHAMLAPRPRTAPPPYCLPPTPLQSSILASPPGRASGRLDSNDATSSRPSLDLSTPVLHVPPTRGNSSTQTMVRHLSPPLLSIGSLDFGARWRWRRSRRA